MEKDNKLVCPACGKEKVCLDTYKSSFIWGCGVYCENFGRCENTGLLIRFALTEKGAVRKAVNAFKKRVEKIKPETAV
jgi:hypothetical protein